MMVRGNTTQEDGDEVPIYATQGQIESFLESLLWRDIQQELKVWHIAVGQGYRSCDTLLELGKIQGRQEAIEYMLSLPDNLLEALKEKALEEKHHDTRRKPASRQHDDQRDSPTNEGDS